MGRPCKYNFDKDEVIELIVTERLSLPLAAKRLKCSYDSLRAFIKRNNIKLPEDKVSASTSSINKVEPGDVQHMLDSHHTYKQIADMFKCKESSVAAFVKKHNLQVSRYNPDPNREELYAMYCDNLMTLGHIANHFGISTDRVKRCLTKYGITRTERQSFEYRSQTASRISSKRYNSAISKFPDAKTLQEELKHNSMSDIISKYGSTRDTITRYLTEAGLTLPQYRPVPSVNLLQTWLDEGLTFKEISQLCGFCEATVSKWVNRYKLVRSDEGRALYNQRKAESARSITLSQYHSSLPAPEELQEHINSYRNYHEIACVYGCSDSAISRCVSRYGINIPPNYDEVVLKNYIQKGKDTVVDKYGVFPYALHKYSQIAQKTLTDSVGLNEFIERIPLKERTWARIATDLGVPDYLVRSYYERHNLQCEISKTLGSSLEEQLRSFLDKSGFVYARNNRSVINPQELDFYFPNQQLAIEVNGNWSHSVNSLGKYAPVTKDYHISKTRKCLDAGIRLIHLFEYEMSNTQYWHKLQKFLNDLLSNRSVIYARNCRIEIVDRRAEQQFLEEFHLQGYVPSSVCYGLYADNQLMSIMSFSKPRFNSNYEFELLRLCTRFGVTIVGGAEKMFSHFVRSYNPDSAVSYCDLSKFTGNVYNRLGMNLVRVSPPNYKWAKFQQVYSRYQCQKHKLSKLLGDAFDPNLSESDNMIEAGFVKIYDCGNAVYEWRK